MEHEGAAAAGLRGHIDFFGYHAGAGGFIFGGWVSHAAAEAIPHCELILGFAERDVRGRGVAAFYPREGLGKLGVGMVLFVPAPERPAGEFFSVTTREHGGRLAVTPTREVRECDEMALAPLLAPLLRDARPPLPRHLVRRLLPDRERPRYTGASTLDSLTDKVMLAIDLAIACPPDGIALIGWLLSDPGVVTGLRLIGGERNAEIDLARTVRVARLGAVEEIGRTAGFEDPRCGFIAFAADALSPGAELHLEVLTASGEVAYHPVPAPRLRGMTAVRHLLDNCDAQFADLAPAFDSVLGPAVTRLAAARLRTKPQVTRIDFGTAPDSPGATLVVPLYGRLDYLEPQLALFAHDPAMRDAELLYVLDEPQRRREAEDLCGSLHARLALPFSLLMLDRNLGFAPASNVGLAAARGATLCFLNSDVFPLANGWLPALTARLAADERLGIVGPLLLREDGTVQHEGMTFHRLPRYGNWFFSHHAREGLLPEGAGLAPAAAVTGACMVLPTALARTLGGFDEGYLIGDFEDSDLCLRARAAGFTCAVDHDVRLCHLGRRSQAAPEERWRMNLVLFNAWVHHARWADTLAGMAP